MPEGSSSAQPVIRPGPRSAKNSSARFCLWAPGGLIEWGVGTLGRRSPFVITFILPRQLTRERGVKAPDGEGPDGGNGERAASEIPGRGVERNGDIQRHFAGVEGYRE